MRTIIAISPIPICCRSNSTTRSSPRAANRLPELPDAKRKRFEGLGITPYNASVLTAEVETARWFDTLLEAGAPPVQGANWVTSELFGALNRMGRIAAGLAGVARRCRRIAAAWSPTRRCRAALPSRCSKSCSRPATAPAKIVEERGLKQTSDTGAIDAKIDEILAANADKVEQYRGGKEALFGFFVGQTMKAMQGKANPQVINERLKAKLGGLNFIRM